MPFSGKKASGFNLDCVLGNVAVTIVTCCGYVFQGTIEDDEYTRAQYGYPVIFPTNPMELDCKKDDTPSCPGDAKKPPCPKPIEVDVEVKCQNEAKFICLRLTVVPANICCVTAAAGGTTDGTLSLVTPIRGTSTGNPNIFAVDDTVLINVNDIVTIGPSRVPLV